MNLALVLIELDSISCLVFLHFVTSIMRLILSSKVLVASPSFGIIGQVINALPVPFFVIKEMLSNDTARTDSMQDPSCYRV